MVTEHGFKTAYAMLASEFKGELTAMQAETHRQMLAEDGITDEELLAGVKAIIKNRKFTNFPRYAELLEAIKGNPDIGAYEYQNYGPFKSGFPDDYPFSPIFKEAINQ